MRDALCSTEGGLLTDLAILSLALTAGSPIPYNGDMNIVEIKDLRKKETPLHYIREFHAVAVIETASGLREAPLAFTIEKKPVGPPDISLRFEDEPEWPLLPLILTMKEMIGRMDKSGVLP